METSADTDGTTGGRMIHRLNHCLFVYSLGILIVPAMAYGKRTENGASPGVCETMYTQWKALDNEDKRLYTKKPRC